MQETGALVGLLGEGDYHPCRGEKEGRRRKIPVLASVESTAIIFWSNPLIKKSERPIASYRLWRCRPVDVVATPPWIDSGCGITCRVK